jgi:hypothetical protein
MPDVLYLCSDCVVHLRMHVCILLYFWLFSSCVFVFPAFEQVFCSPSCACQLVYYDLVCLLRTGFYFAFEDTILIYSLSFRLCVCALTCLFIESLGFRYIFIFCFIDLVTASSHVDFHLFWNAFVCVSPLLLSPLPF